MSRARFAAAFALATSSLGCQARTEPIVPTPPDIASVLAASAPEAPPIEPSSAASCASLVERAVARDPEVMARTARIREKVALARAAGAEPPPMVMATLWQAPLHKPFVYGDGSMLMMGLSQTIVPKGVREGEARAMLAEASAMLAEVGERALTTSAEISRVCADLGEVRARVALSERRAKLLDALADVARARLSSGGSGMADLSRIDLERARVDGDRAELSARDAELVAAANGLVDREAGAPVDVAPNEPPKVPKETAEQLVKRSTAARPENAVRDAMVARDVARADAAHAMATVPMVTVGVNYGLSRPSGMPDTWGASVAMTLPWLSGGARATEEAARHGAVAAAHEGAARSRMARREISEAYAKTTGLARRLEQLSTRTLPAARRAAAAVRATYAGGTGDLNGWLDALRAEVEIEEQAAMLRAELARAVLALERAVGSRIAVVSMGGADEH